MKCKCRDKGHECVLNNGLRYWVWDCKHANASYAFLIPGQKVS